MARARRLAEEAGLAFSLLTRIPLPRFEIRTEASLASAFWAYPPAGIAASCLAAAGLWAAFAATGDATVAAVVAIPVGALATGGLHEDGLADFWDGIGGGATRERRLEIMRDSRIGTYGALALILAVVLRIALLAALVGTGGVALAAAAIVACGGLARAAMGMPFATLVPARPDGLAAQVRRPPAASLAAGCAIAGVAALVLLGTAAVAAIVGALAGAGLVTWFASRTLGGHTGDVLGATAVTAEILALFAVAGAVR